MFIKKAKQLRNRFQTLEFLLTFSLYMMLDSPEHEESVAVITENWSNIHVL